MKLSRRALFKAAAASGPLALAQTVREPYPGVSYRNYARCLPDYLHDLAWSFAKSRQAELAKLVTPETIVERQKWARQTFWRLIGGGFEKTPLNAKVTGTVDRPGYQIQKVVYESRPGFFVTANLYIPASNRKSYPAVLFQCGHAQAGKGC